MSPVLPLTAVSLALGILRFRQPWARRPRGETTLVWSVPLPARVRLQRANVYAIAALLILGGVGGWLPFAAQIVIVAATVGTLLLPLRYQLTERDLALGRTPPLELGRVTGLTEAAGCVRLATAERQIVVWLPGGMGDAKMIASLRRAITKASTDTAVPMEPSAHGVASRRQSRVRHRAA